MSANINRMEPAARSLLPPQNQGRFQTEGCGLFTAILNLFSHCSSSRQQSITGKDFSVILDTIESSNNETFKGFDKRSLRNKVDRFIFHGTNSAILSAIEENFTFHATGELLNHGMAPMGGEISLGGMNVNGVNQTHISGDTLKGISRCWEYATSRSHTFDRAIFESENACRLFLETLEKLSLSSPNSNNWDELIVSLLRLKQWNFADFVKLCRENKENIEKLLDKHQNILSSAQKFLKASTFDIDALRRGITDKEHRAKILCEIGYNGQYDDYLDSYWKEDLYFLNSTHSSLNPDKNFGILWKSIFTIGDEDKILIDIINFRLAGQFNQPQMIAGGSEKWVPNEILRENLDRLGSSTTEDPWLKQRVNRLMFLFNLEHRPIKLEGQEARSCILQPFPILLGSTILPLHLNDRSSEYLIDSGVVLGKDIDLMIVKRENYSFMKNWLQEHHLIERVGLYTEDLIEKARRTTY